MARPRIGIFGALVAVGGVIAWRWAQKHRASQARLSNELNRWEAEGGALAGTAQAAPVEVSVSPGDVSPGDVSPGAVPNGRAHVGGTRDAWRFPHS